MIPFRRAMWHTMMVCIASVYGSIDVAAQATSSVMSRFANTDAQPLRVLRVVPTDTNAWDNTISVTFDRPVAGMLGKSIDAMKVMRMHPQPVGVIQWRDPSTIQFVAESEMAPGSVFDVEIDTAHVQSRGARTGAPYRFTVRIPPAMMLAKDIDGKPPEPYYRVAPRPIFHILYSGTVNLDSIARRSRLEFAPSCHAEPVMLQVIRQRPVQPDDHFEWERRPNSYSTYYEDHNAKGAIYRRVVELTTRDTLPSDCDITWHVPSLNDVHPDSTWRYHIHSVPSFTLKHLTPCIDVFDARGDGCDPIGLTPVFSVPPGPEGFA